MSTKKFDERITTRYNEPKRDIYEQVMALVKKNSIPKSTAQLLLVERGLQHTQNPEPLVKTVVKEVPIEKIKTVIKEVPVEKIVEKVVYKSPPKVDKSTPHIEEHVSIEEHITDESIGGDHKAGQHPSGETLMTQDKADPPNKEALEAKNSPEGVPGEEKQGISGWKVAGGLGVAGLIALIGYRIWQVYH